MSIEHGPEPNGIESAPQGFQPDDTELLAMEEELVNGQRQRFSDVIEHGPEPIPIENGIESAPQGFQPDESMLLAMEEELGQRQRFSDVMASLQFED